MFHMLAYFEQLGAAATDSDINAVTDPEITVRNNHFIFTEPYNVLAAFYNAAGALRARLNVPTLNYFARHQLYPVLRSATIPDLPFMIDYRDFPLALPQNEEIAIEGTNNAGAGDDTYVSLLVAPPGWNRNVPRSGQKIVVRATYSITTAAQGVWSAAGALTFAENLRGGWYAVTGMDFFDANTLYARLIFPRGNVVNGRRLRPGALSINAAGNRPWIGFNEGMGVWGRFHSFEPPQIEILSANAAAHTGEVRLSLVYLGNTSTVAGI